MENLTEEIKLYLNDEAALYQRWESLVYEAEHGRQLVSMKSKIAESKAKAQIWLQKIYTQHRDYLRQACREQQVNYQVVEIGLLTNGLTELITQLSSILEKCPEFRSVVGLALVTAMMMIIRGVLDEVCNESS